MVAQLSFLAAFNLVCTGVVSGPKAPFTTTLSIDTEAKLWCQQPCKAVHRIAGRRDSEIVLEAVTTSKAGVVTTRQITVSQETGLYSEIATTAGKARIARGTCETATFTPFPKKK